MIDNVNLKTKRIFYIFIVRKLKKHSLLNSIFVCFLNRLRTTGTYRNIYLWYSRNVLTQYR